MVYAIINYGIYHNSSFCSFRYTIKVTSICNFQWYQILARRILSLLALNSLYCHFPPRSCSSKPKKKVSIYMYGSRSVKLSDILGFPCGNDWKTIIGKSVWVSYPNNLGSVLWHDFEIAWFLDNVIAWLLQMVNDLPWSRHCQSASMIQCALVIWKLSLNLTQWSWWSICKWISIYI